MRSETINLYEFDELTEEQQEAVIEKHRGINSDSIEFLIDEKLENLVEKINKNLNMEIRKEDLIYEIGNDRRDKLGVKDQAIENDIRDEYGLIRFQTNIPEKIGVFTSHLGGGVCSLGNTEKGKAEVIEYEQDGDREEDIKEELERELNKKIDKVVEICEEILKDCKEMIEDMYSDEQVAETIRLNEMEFSEEELRGLE